MKHIHTFESFVNESLNEELITLKFNDDYQSISPTDGTPDPTRPRFVMHSSKKGWVFAADGSHGTESRLIVRCDASQAEKAYQAAVQKFTGKTWNDFDKMKKEVSEFLKKNC